MLIFWVALAPTASTAAAAVLDHPVIAAVQTAGVTASDEWILLYNPADAPVALSGWSMQYKSAVGATWIRKNFPEEAFIPASGWFLIGRPETVSAPTTTLASAPFSVTVSSTMTQSTFSLAGEGGNIFLVAATGTLKSATSTSVVDRVGYGTGDSFEGAATGEGAAASAPPIGKFLLRRQDEIGNFLDTDNNVDDFFVWEPPTSNPPASDPQLPAFILQSPTSSPPDAGVIVPPQNIFINELMADPLPDDDEWIELYNKGDASVSLEGWRLEDASRAKTFLHGNVNANDFFVVNAIKGHLNNDGDDVYLFNSEERIIDFVRYGKVSEKSDGAEKPGDGQALSRVMDGLDSNRDPLDFAVTDAPTPNAPNKIVRLSYANSSDKTPTTGFEPRRLTPLNFKPRLVIQYDGAGALGDAFSFDASESTDADDDTLAFLWRFDDGFTATSSLTSYIFGATGSHRVLLSVSDGPHTVTKTVKVRVTAPPDETDTVIVNAATGKKTIAKKSSQKLAAADGNVTLRGIVLAAPDIIGSREIPLLLLPTSTERAAIILRNKKDRQKFAPGDIISATGRSGEHNGIMRLTNVAPLGIKKISDGMAPEPEELNINELDENYYGKLIRLHGVISEIKSPRFYLADGGSEITVYLREPAKIPKSAIKKDAVTTVTGIFLPSADGDQVLPRSKSDIILEMADAPSSTPLTILNNNERGRARQYLALLTGGAIGTFGAVRIVKKIRRKRNEAAPIGAARGATQSNAPVQKNESGASSPISAA
ncbi:MAG: Ig domain protein group 2 domain protein [Candidatus Magasanikbacteria bacterium]|nr:Ig domain protein group 2 domain protein [Candidatus Magasanikbacteria bacterium]